MDLDPFILWWVLHQFQLGIFHAQCSSTDSGYDPSHRSVILGLLSGFLLDGLSLIGLFGNISGQLSLQYQSLYFIFKGMAFISVVAVVLVEVVVLPFVPLLKGSQDLRGLRKILLVFYLQQDLRLRYVEQSVLTIPMLEFGRTLGTNRSVMLGLLVSSSLAPSIRPANCRVST